MELLTVEETASILKLSPYTIREMLNQKKLPGIKVGRQWRIREQDLLRFLESGTATATEADGTDNARSSKSLATASEGLETAILSEAVLAREWLTPEEDEYWAHLRKARS
ncbi:MAG TPA: helix-turn-helix domain-containing protein [Chloroflexia bacterium]